VALSAREWAELEAASQPSGTPDLAAIAAVMRSLRLRGLVVTVAGDGCAAAVTAGGVTEQPQRSRLHASLSADVRAQLAFTSRFFAPHCGIDEDPVTGSAHALLARFWAAAAPAGATMLGYQASARGGLVRVRACEGPGDVVQVEGEATTVIRARLLA
jgi:predicted PhzF superfamily epimerase YddE/YHI9